MAFFLLLLWMQAKGRSGSSNGRALAMVEVLSCTKIALTSTCMYQCTVLNVSELEVKNSCRAERETTYIYICLVFISEMYHHNCCCIYFLCQEIGMDGHRLHGTIAIGSSKVLPMCCIHASDLEQTRVRDLWWSSWKWCKHEFSHPFFLCASGCTMSYNCAGGWQDWTDGKGAFAMSIQVLKSFAWACIYIYIYLWKQLWVGHSKLIGGGVFGVFYLHASLLQSPCQVMEIMLDNIKMIMMMMMMMVAQASPIASLPYMHLHIVIVILAAMGWTLSNDMSDDFGCVNNGFLPLYMCVLVADPAPPAKARPASSASGHACIVNAMPNWIACCNGMN